MRIQALAVVLALLMVCTVGCASKKNSSEDISVLETNPTPSSSEGSLDPEKGTPEWLYEKSLFPLPGFTPEPFGSKLSLDERWKLMLDSIDVGEVSVIQHYHRWVGDSSRGDIIVEYTDKQDIEDYFAKLPQWQIIEPVRLIDHYQIEDVYITLKGHEVLFLRILEGCSASSPIGDFYLEWESLIGAAPR